MALMIFGRGINEADFEECVIYPKFAIARVLVSMG